MWDKLYLFIKLSLDILYKICLALYNKNDLIASPKTFCVHDAPVNCLSFCSWDPHKLFSTSHDGSVKYGDTVNYTFDTVSKIDFYIYLFL